MDVSNYLRYKSCGSWPRQTNKKLRWSCTVTVNLYQVNSQCWPVRPVLLINHWNMSPRCQRGPGAISWWCPTLFRLMGHGSSFPRVNVVHYHHYPRYHQFSTSFSLLLCLVPGGNTTRWHYPHFIHTQLHNNNFKHGLVQVRFGYKWCSDGNLSLTNAVEALYFISFCTPHTLGTDGAVAW